MVQSRTCCLPTLFLVTESLLSDSQDDLNGLNFNTAFSHQVIAELQAQTRQ